MSDRIREHEKRATLTREIISNIRKVNAELTTTGLWNHIPTNQLEVIKLKLDEVLSTIPKQK